MKCIVNEPCPPDDSFYVRQDENIVGQTLVVTGVPLNSLVPFGEVAIGGIRGQLNFPQRGTWADGSSGYKVRRLRSGESVTLKADGTVDAQLEKPVPDRVVPFSELQVNEGGIIVQAGACGREYHGKLVVRTYSKIVCLDNFNIQWDEPHKITGMRVRVFRPGTKIELTV